MNLLDRIRARGSSVPSPARPDPGSPLGDRLKARAGERRGAHISETQRVVDMPTEDFAGADLTDELRTPTGTMTLRPIQSEALAAIRANSGGFKPIGVGHGKSLIGLLSGTVLDARLAIMLTPASTVETLRNTYAETRGHFRMVTTRILSYEMLSSPKGTGILKRLMAGISPRKVVIVCDEAHKLKSRRSVRTRRFVRFLQDNPEVMVVAMSGTMTAKGLDDFKHLAELCLRDGSPLPRDAQHFGSWKACLDVNGRPGPMDWERVRPLWQRYIPRSIEEARGKARRAGIREAFQRRLRSAPGVVASRAGSLGCSLRIAGRDHQLPPEILELLDALDADGSLPDGDIAADDISVWRAYRQLSQGFYLRWDWPNNEPDEEWLEARRNWNACLRRELEQRSDEGYDSGFLVASKIQRDLASGSVLRRRMIHDAWIKWAAQKDKQQPPTEAIWLDHSLINSAVEWLRKQRLPSILWYEHQTVGDALEERGVLVYRAGEQPVNDGKPCAMSIAAHGVGKNLQSWNNQLVLCPPSSGHVWEQLLGRTHRPGQDADEVLCEVYTHTPRFLGAVIGAIEDAEYIEKSTGNMQKILFADRTL